MFFLYFILKTLIFHMEDSMHPGSSSPMDELLVGVGLDGLITARKEDLDKEEDIFLV